MSARQLHNAHNQLCETIIRYRFHPRYGQTVTVTSRNRRGNDVAVTIRQPDGTLAQLPIWMTEDSAEAMAVTEIPRLPLAHLRELRLELDACLTLQLPFCFEVRALGDGLVSSAPEGPCDGVCRLNPLSIKSDGNAANFLD